MNSNRQRQLRTFNSRRRISNPFEEISMRGAEPKSQTQAKRAPTSTLKQKKLPRQPMLRIIHEDDENEVVASIAAATLPNVVEEEIINAPAIRPTHVVEKSPLTATN
jgi:hypothetical protein